MTQRKRNTQSLYQLIQAQHDEISRLKAIVPSPERCSFCFSGHQNCRILIAGPNATICNECVEKCRQVMRDAKKRKRTAEEV